MSDIELLGLGGVAIIALFLVVRAFLNRGKQAASDGGAEASGE